MYILPISFYLLAGTMGPSISDVGKFFMIFDPYPPTVGSFLLLSIGKFGQFLTPPPLKNADVLNGWSLSGNCISGNHVSGNCIMQGLSVQQGN